MLLSDCKVYLFVFLLDRSIRWLFLCFEEYQQGQKQGVDKNCSLKGILSEKHEEDKAPSSGLCHRGTAFLV